MARRSIGVDAYGQLLAQSAPWRDIAARYGQGSGYKRTIADQWRDWFEQSAEAQHFQRAVTQRLQDAWSTWVIAPLIQAVQVTRDVV